MVTEKILFCLLVHLWDAVYWILFEHQKQGTSGEGEKTKEARG